MAENFNYIDAINNSLTRENNAKLYDASVESTGRSATIFLQDYSATDKNGIDNVYGEVKYKPVYLPPFIQKCLYKTNTFTSGLTLNFYEEKEQNLIFEFSFDRLVANIRNLKNKQAGLLKIKNTNRQNIVVNIFNSIIEIYLDKKILFKEDLNKFPTIQDFCGINIPNVFLIYEGDNVGTKNLNAVNNLIIQKGKTREVQIKDNTYENSNDIIETGSLILTDRYRLYKILNTNFRNDSFGMYLCYECIGNLVNLSQVDGLPIFLRNEIEKRQYNVLKYKNL